VEAVLYAHGETSLADASAPFLILLSLTFLHRPMSYSENYPDQRLSLSLLSSCAILQKVLLLISRMLHAIWGIVSWLQASLKSQGKDFCRIDDLLLFVVPHCLRQRFWLQATVRTTYDTELFEFTA
jgi:hypothetical protein